MKIDALQTITEIERCLFHQGYLDIFNDLTMPGREVILMWIINSIMEREELKEKEKWN